MTGAKNDAGSMSAPQLEAGISPTQPDGSASQADAGVSAGDAGTAPVPDAAVMPDAAQVAIPPAVSAPMVWGIGIGVSDLPAAVKFFTDVMKLTVEKEGIKRDDRTETILYASMAKRGARLVLMSFDDKRNTRKITAKLVWQASNSGAVNSAASKYPGYVSRVSFPVVQFDGPDTYIQEVGSIFVSGGGDIAVPYLIATGFSVSDLAKSRQFYVSLGMTESRTGAFPVTDATGSGNITEYTVKWSEGSGIVLQDWSPERNSKDNPVKLVLFVPDAQAMADKVVASGGAILKAAERTSVYDNRLVLVAKDRDGYLLELVQ
jgi:catechol 2,3-dioxygenase-like lactoylglutathione lyase family enzyme